MTKIKELHKKWMGDAEYRREYDALEEEFALASALIAARARAGLTQEELAQRMGKNAREHIQKNFSIRRHLDCIDDVVARARKSR